MKRAKKRKTTRLAVSDHLQEHTDLARASFPNRYNAVVHAARLTSLALVSNEFRVAPEFFATPERDLSYEGELSDFSFDEAQGVVGGTFEWWVEARVGTRVVLRHSCRYTIYYDGLGGRDSDAAKSFLKRVGRYATYPYFRALTAQLSWESAAGLPPMPVLRDDPHPATAPRLDSAQPVKKAARR